MKRLLATAALILSVALCSNASAFTEFKMVGALNSEDVKSEFGWNETPYLFAQFPSAGNIQLDSFWLDDGFESYYAGAQLAEQDGSKVWITLSNWDSVKKTGLWEVYGSYSFDNEPCTNDCGFTRFVVTPEPMSMVLFGLGGLPLAGRFLRRRSN